MMLRTGVGCGDCHWLQAARTQRAISERQIGCYQGLTTCWHWPLASFTIKLQGELCIFQLITLFINLRLGAKRPLLSVHPKTSANNKQTNKQTMLIRAAWRG